MKSRALITILYILFAVAGLASLGAESPTEAYTLGNGLDVILLPLPGSGDLSMGIVFRGGAEVQTSANAGQFGLLEQLLFRGTASEPGDPEPAGALEALDAAAFDGGVKTDRFAFAFSLSPELLDQGLNTLSHLFSGLSFETALSDPSALSAAKDSSVARMQAAKNEPTAIFEYALAKKLFSSAPWRLDAIGSEKTLREATGASLKTLASRWLVPNNAALLLAGDFDPESAKTHIASAFASWKKAENPWKTAQAALPKPGVTRPTLVVYPDPTQRKGYAALEMRYRGPDIGSSRSAAVQLWVEMVSQPDSRLAKALSKGMPKNAASSTPKAHYQASRSASWFSVSTTIVIEGSGNPADTVLAFKEIVRGTEMYAMKTNAGYFSAVEYKNAKEALDAFPKAEGSQNAISSMMNLWLLNGIESLQTGKKSIQAISSKDITSFADEYLMKNLEIVSIRLNPEDYSAKKKYFDNYGFELISSQNAFWWK
ncbi:MAG: insulinase family protein [Spirochaetia bacterium]|jgi:zinc protease|nr:insulinase family protein [Spirochaetia bacterium]